MTTIPDSAGQHDWEHAKENAAPLACGRTVKSLARRALGPAGMEAAEEKTRRYERLVRRGENAAEWMQQRWQERAAGEGGSAFATEEEEEAEAAALRARLTAERGFDPSTSDRECVDYDPLRYWVLYVKHIRECYPSDARRQFLVMERCARTWMARPFLVPRYRNDPRFVRICILYAEKTSNPSEVFKLMSKIKVGTKVSIFWIAWAWCAEKAEDFPFTEKIFQKALSVGAEPRKQLLERQKHFLRRMSRHWLNASQAHDESHAEDEDEGRGVLNSLSSAAVSRNDRASTVGQPQQQRNGSRHTSSRSRPPQGRRENKPSVGFDIFQEENDSPRDVFDEDEHDPGGRRRLVKESERTKENHMRPELWNERGYGLVNPATEASAAASGIGADSIVGMVRDSATAFGRPDRPHRTGSAAAFDVFVDEEFNNDENEAKRSATEKPTDQRSLRQLLDGGAADRLARDPLRYMKNPSKIKADQRKYDTRPDDSGDASGRRKEEAKHRKLRKPEPKGVKTGNGGLGTQVAVKEDGSGEECYEEQRLNAAYYKLISAEHNINSLKLEIADRNSSSQTEVSESMDVEESIDDVEMEDDTEEVSRKHVKSVLKSSLRNRHAACNMKNEEVSTAANPRRVLFGANTNVVYTHNASVNTSTASSQPNESLDRPEETINTKLANAEISMMFSSPNANASIAETPGKLMLSPYQPLFSANSKKNPVGSSFAIHDENKEPGLNFSVYQDTDTIEKKDGIASNGLSFAIHDENKQQFAIHEENNFSIQDDTNEQAHDRKKTEDKGSDRIAIHDESRKVSSGGLSFSIHQDDAGEEADVNDDVDGSRCSRFAVHAESKKSSGAGLNFQIHQDVISEQHELKATKEASRYSGEDTASLSVIGNVMDDLGIPTRKVKSSAPSGFEIDSDTAHSRTKHTDRSKREASEREPRKKVESAAEDTASLSLIGDVIGSLETCSAAKPPRKSGTDCGPREPSGFKIFADENDAPKRDEIESAGMGFEIFTDEPTTSVRKKQKAIPSNEPCFGVDISRIEDEKTSNIELPLDGKSSNIRPNESQQKAVDYNSLHKDDCEAAMRKCLAKAGLSGYAIFDYRKKQIPNALLRKSFRSGTKIDLFRGETVTIVNELGRGAYGVVLLCNDESGHSDALKIQAPIGSLAHEYSLSMVIEDRVHPHDSAFYPFPRSRALYAFSEGGLFSMTAGSDSGMTLIDVVNTCKRTVSNVPEMIAIYYTSRMLKHLELLHQEGKVLHCDVKPDNWVLTSSPKDRNNAGVNSIGGADLMLVDFGRSIDLEKVSGSDPLRAKFKGSAAAEDMECGSMRKGMPWGVDLDFYGLAASSFVLLFGSHMEVLEDKRTGKWRLRKSLRRYWQRELLWTPFFDALLNFDPFSDNYCLSDLRVMFEEYIDGKQRRSEMQTHLNQLYTHLPKKRS